MLHRAGGKCILVELTLCINHSISSGDSSSSIAFPLAPFRVSVKEDERRTRSINGRLPSKVFKFFSLQESSGSLETVIAIDTRDAYVGVEEKEPLFVTGQMPPQFSL